MHEVVKFIVYTQKISMQPVHIKLFMLLGFPYLKFAAQECDHFSMIIWAFVWQTE